VNITCCRRTRCPERAKPESSIELAVQTIVPGYFLAGSK
jgi:hypothetical protein